MNHTNPTQNNPTQNNSISRLIPRPMSDEIMECILPYITDPRDRGSISTVCKRWHDLDRWTRRHVTIALCYTTTPHRLLNRFPNLESLKLKGKPRAAMFNLIPEDWGGYATPWINMLSSFPKLNSIHLRRMIVTDTDLSTLATVKSPVLVSLKLDKCSGFSTDGLLAITRSCRTLKTLVFEDSTVTDTGGEWLHQLALNNTVLETLSFFMTFLEQISVEDLELLASRCPLISVKITETNLEHLGKFFRTTPALQEFCGGSLPENTDCPAIAFPAQLTSVGLMYFQKIHMPLVLPVVQSLRSLDLVYATLCRDGHCDLIRRCPNLEVLETTNIIGDEGLEIVARSCKNLKRLRIERGADEQEPEDDLGVVTERGLIAIAEGCRELEYLAIYVTDITNRALASVGANLKNLNDFRLVLLDKEVVVPDLPLDNGVRALLQGCQNLKRFALYVRSGGLSDVGLGYIGQFSQNVRWMLLGYVGDTDAGILEFSRGCPSLQKLEIRACTFTERALAIAATQLVSLRYMWVQGYTSSDMGIVDLLQMVRPFWNIELIPGNQYEVDGENGQTVTVDQPSHIVAYYSLAGPRTDHPPTVFPIAPPNANQLELPDP